MMSNDRNAFQGGAVCDAKVVWTDFVPAVALLVAGLLALAVATVMATPVQGQFLVMAPRLDAENLMDAVYRAGGGVVGLGGIAGIAIAASDDAGFKSAVLAQGAWFVVPSPRILGCFTQTERAGG